ncbi:MAG TPA: gluconate 2-dehydrogenase subunit 3 family protein [Thermoanaerobaculia bacterium]|nr:gluconate 2-dehydrogenase subunit 3 family protein [Thermoanaerobaculia bacterium]
MKSERPTRRAVLRHFAFAGFGAAALPLWARERAHQQRTIVALAERIIPGAAQAQADRYITAYLADAHPQRRAEFLAGLADLDRRCRSAYSCDFIRATAEQQTALVERLDPPFFAQIKMLTITGYYTSRLVSEELAR